MICSTVILAKFIFECQAYTGDVTAMGTGFLRFSKHLVKYFLKLIKLFNVYQLRQPIKKFKVIFFRLFMTLFQTTDTHVQISLDY